MRSELQQRFSETVREALAKPGTRAPPFELLLPPALRETMIATGPFEPLAQYYCERMPLMLVEQMLRGDDPARRLLWRSLELARLPRLEAALRGMFAALGEEGPRLLGAPSAEALVSARPSIAALAAPSLLGCGLPLVGAWPMELELINRDLAAEKDPYEVLDLRLSGAIVHELCHGLRRELHGPPAPWMVLESAAGFLGWLAYPRHVFPELAGEALPGTAPFLLLGQCLARLFGRRALLRTMGGAPLQGLFPEGAAEALDAAAREDFKRRREVPFARDALAAPAWVKLADASRAGLGVTLAEAAALDFDALPWWSEEPLPEDLELARSAVRSLFQVNVLAGTYQTHPCEARELRLDTRTCLLQRPARSDGVYGEPPFWIWPPPLCRKLLERGARSVQVEGARRGDAEALLELCFGRGPLPEVVRWTSSG